MVRAKASAKSEVPGLSDRSSHPRERADLGIGFGDSADKCLGVGG